MEHSVQWFTYQDMVISIDFHSHEMVAQMVVENFETAQVLHKVSL